MPSALDNRLWLRIRTTGVMFDGLKPIVTDEKLDPPANACFNCWELGHTRRACPRPIVPGDLCHNCGRLFVIMSTCPRSAEAYSVWARRKDEEKYGLRLVPPQASSSPEKSVSPDVIVEKPNSVAKSSDSSGQVTLPLEAQNVLLKIWEQSEKLSKDPPTQMRFLKSVATLARREQN